MSLELHDWICDVWGIDIIRIDIIKKEFSAGLSDFSVALSDWNDEMKLGYKYFT